MNRTLWHCSTTGKSTTELAQTSPHTQSSWFGDEYGKELGIKGVRCGKVTHQHMVIRNMCVTWFLHLYCHIADVKLQIVIDLHTPLQVN
ncbi:hypothetical protein FKM82_024893 [Ascaphus truei]